jgi:stress response protein YsnF
MALLKLKDFDPNYHETFGGYDIKGLDVYSNVNNEKIGSVHDLLVDEQGHFRYFILDLGFWGFGKKVLLPVGRAQIDSDGKQIHAIGFTKEQAENLPEFNESLKIDRDYEEKVRGVYRPAQTPPQMQPLEAPRNTSVMGSGHPQQPPMPAQPSGNRPMTSSDSDPYRQMPPTSPAQQAPMTSQAEYYDPNDYNYHQEPALYGMNQQNHSVLQRYEERLLAKKKQANQAR